MSINGIIIEDEELTAERLENLVSEHTDVTIIARLSSVKSAMQWLDQNENPDILFLDIQLGDGTGFDILQHIDTWPHVVFTTAFDQYVLEAFKYNSLDYLLKPIKAEDLKRAVQKLQHIQKGIDLSGVIDHLNSQLFKKFKRKFLVKTGLKYRSVSVDEISCFYSKESVTHIRSSDGNSWIVDYTLDEVESIVDPQQFFRINRHILVKEDGIASINSYFNSRLLLEIKPPFEGELIVSREKVKLFKQWLEE